MREFGFAPGIDDAELRFDDATSPGDLAGRFELDLFVVSSGEHEGGVDAGKEGEVLGMEKVAEIDAALQKKQGSA